MDGLVGLFAVGESAHCLRQVGQQRVEEALVLFERGDVIWITCAVRALERISFVVVQFDGLDLVRDGRRVGAEVGAPPLKAVAGRAVNTVPCEARRSMFGDLIHGVP